MKAPEILDKAAQHMRDRAATYDKPEGERSMGLTVAIFNLHHGTSLTEAQGWHLMQILKDVRLFARPGYHADSAEDCTAYSALKAEAMALQAETDNADNAPVVVPPPPEYAPESVAIDDGWIDHDGNGCPVDNESRVFVAFRDGTKSCAPYFAKRYAWDHNGSMDDVMKWKPA